MSSNDPRAESIMAQWRRAGFGVWKLVFIVEGYDDEYTHLLPGRLSARKAKKRGIQMCAKELDVRIKWVHLKTQEKIA